MNEAVPPLSILELDQLDIMARLQVDPFFQAGVPLVLQLKGITEQDILEKIQTLNQANGYTGSVAIVLMPRLIGVDPNAPGPFYDAVYGIQVIDWPVVRRQAQVTTPKNSGGTQKSADEIADRVRQILHRFCLGRGQTLYFSSQSPVTIEDGKVSYEVKFKRRGADQPPQACASVLIVPQLVLFTRQWFLTMSCSTAGASIYFTSDGSYPSSINPTATLYTSQIGPINEPMTPLIYRAAAELPASGFQQSSVSQITLFQLSSSMP